MSMTRKNSPEIIAAAMRALSVHPNRPEMALLGLLRQVAPVWEFVGDGTLIVGGKSPDFQTNDGSNLLCEMYGDYWHRNDDPQERIDWFAQFGYKTIVVWERELRNPYQVLSRLHEFMSAY